MIVSNSFNPDPRVYKEARSLISNGFSVRVVAWNRDGTHPSFEIIDGIEVERIGIPTRYGAFWSYASKLPIFYLAFLRRYLLNGRNFDVVHTHDFDTAFLGFLLKFFLGLKWVYDVHDLYDSLVNSAKLSRLMRFFDSLFLSFSDSVITVNHKMTKILMDRARLRRNFVIMNTIFPFDMKQEKWKSFTLFYGGVFSPDRFIEEILDLCASLRIPLRIAGIGILEPIVRESDATFLGYLPHNEALLEMAKAHLTFILYDPSVLNNRIASPNKLFEAMCLKTPVLVVKGTLPEKLAEKFVIPVDYSKEDVKRTLEYLRDNPKILRKKGHLGRKIFLKNYTWDVMEKRLLKLYSEVLK